jgi:hypothetical protein
MMGEAVGFGIQLGIADLAIPVHDGQRVRTMRRSLFEQFLNLAGPAHYCFR